MASDGKALIEAAKTMERKEAELDARAEQIVQWLKNKWGDPHPCPYCTNDVWSVDPDPILLQRLGGLPGSGIPAYLVRCEHCGHEVALSAEVLDIWPIGGT